MSTYSGSLFPRSLTFYNKTITFLGQYLYIKSKMSLRSRSEQPQARSAVGCECLFKRVICTDFSQLQINIKRSIFLLFFLLLFLG